MTILSPTGLETADYNVPGWVHIYNRNVDRLNAILLAIQALGDVDAETIRHNAILTWNASSGKWEGRRYIKAK